MKRIWFGLIILALTAGAQPVLTAWEVLKKGLAETNPDRRKQAVLALASIGPAPEVVELMSLALRDKEIMVRQAAAAAIGENRLRASIPFLRATLDDTGEVAFTAAKALWEMGDRSGEQLLEDTYSQQASNGPGMMESAVRDAKAKLRDRKGLAVMGLQEASGALLGPLSMGITMAQDALRDSGAPGRALALSLLAQDCEPRKVQLMEWSMEVDSNSLVRAATAKALGRCGSADTILKLMPFLLENNVSVRYMTAAAIVRLSIEKSGK
jgi:HEAT repeat protein